MSEKGRRLHSQIATAWNNTDPRLRSKDRSALLGRTHKQDSEEAKFICKWQKHRIPKY